MLILKCIIAFSLIVTGQLIWANTALAWGPAVHTLIALNLLEDARLILPSIAGTLTLFPLEFIYGCLAADFFVGKSKMKRANHAHHWKGGFKFLSEADNEQEAAYAFGFLSHLAADVVAHNFFIPNMTSENRALRKKSHLYWEIRADHVVGLKYTKIARDVLGMNHNGCDDLLKVICGKRKNGIKARKLIFTQSVKFSDRAHSTHHFFFPNRIPGKHGFNEYACFMVNLSCRVAKGVLKDPKESPCLDLNPMGVRDRNPSERFGTLDRFFNPRRSNRTYKSAESMLKS